MSAPRPSRDYSRMARAEAVQHFAKRERRIKAEIVSLPTAEKLKLAGEMLEAGVAPNLVQSVTSLALSELDGLVGRSVR